MHQAVCDWCSKVLGNVEDKDSTWYRLGVAKAGSGRSWRIWDEGADWARDACEECTAKALAPYWEEAKKAMAPKPRPEPSPEPGPNLDPYDP